MSDLYDGLRARGCIDPLIFRAMVQCQIGKDCPFPTIKAAADHYGLHPEHLRMFVRGLRPAEPKLLEAFGLERVVLYAPATPTTPTPDERATGAEEDV